MTYLPPSWSGWSPPPPGPGASYGPSSSPHLPQPARSPLQGTGLVGDDLYLLAHDDRTGKPVLPSRTLGIVLAGGLLAELYSCGSIAMTPGDPVMPGLRRPGEPVTAHMLDVIAAEQVPYPLPDWLSYFALTAAESVGTRLQRAGYLVRVRGWPWRSRLAPADADWAYAAVLRAARPQDVYGAVLSGLARAGGLRFRLDEAGTASFTAPGLNSALRELITQVKTATDSAVLAHRT